MHSLGIRALELAYIRFTPEEIDAVERVSKRLDINIAATQITWSYLNKKRDWVLKFHEQLTCSRACVSVLPTAAIKGGRDGILQFAAQLDELGAYYRERGLKLCFHHHDFEFQRLGDSLGLDLLLRETDPQNVGFVIDTYWATCGGQAASSLIRRLGNRVQGIHLRDFGLRWKLINLVPNDVELGAGNLDIADMVNACVDNNIAYMAIEHAVDKPYDSIEQSVAHLRQLDYGNLF